MNGFKKFKSWSRLRQIGSVVLAVHFFFIFCLTVHHFISRIPPKRPIAVRTVRAPVSQTTVAQAPQPQKKVVSKPPQKITAPPTKPSKQKTAVSKTEKTPAPSKPTSEQAIPQTPNISKPAPELFIPQMPDVKPLYIEESSFDLSYEEKLISLFQSALDLPEMGEVKARLEIDAKGQLVSCTILESRSRKNEEFLKNRLPELFFPRIEGTEKQTFTVTFRNAN